MPYTCGHIGGHTYVVYMWAHWWPYVRMHVGAQVVYFNWYSVRVSESVDWTYKENSFLPNYLQCDCGP